MFYGSSKNFKLLSNKLDTRQNTYETMKIVSEYYFLTEYGRRRLSFDQFGKGVVSRARAFFHATGNHAIAVFDRLKNRHAFN